MIRKVIAVIVALTVFFSFQISSAALDDNAGSGIPGAVAVTEGNAADVTFDNGMAYVVFDPPSDGEYTARIFDANGTFSSTLYSVDSGEEIECADKQSTESDTTFKAFLNAESSYCLIIESDSTSSLKVKFEREGAVQETVKVAQAIDMSSWSVEPGILVLDPDAGNDKVSFSVRKIDPDDGLTELTAIFANGSSSKSITLSQDSEDETLLTGEWTITDSDDFEPGTYAASHLTCNVPDIYSDAEADEIEDISFSVFAKSEGAETPQLISITAESPAGGAAPGSAVPINARISSDSVIRTVYAVYDNASSSQTTAVDLFPAEDDPEASAQGKLFVGTFDVGELMVSGEWRVSYVYIEDINGNETSVIAANPDDPDGEGFDMSGAVVTVNNEEGDGEAPVISDISIDTAQNAEGRWIVTAQAKITDTGSGVDEAWIEYVNGDETIAFNVPLAPSDAEDIYTAEQDVTDEFGADYSGIFYAATVAARDAADNTTYMYDSSLYGLDEEVDDNSVDLSAGWIFSNLDTTAPVLTEGSLAVSTSEVVWTSEMTEPVKVIVSLRAADNDAVYGLAYIRLTSSEDPEYVHLIELELNHEEGDLYTAVFDIDADSPAGTYQLDELILTDESANSVTYLNSALSHDTDICEEHQPTEESEDTSVEYQEYLYTDMSAADVTVRSTNADIIPPVVDGSSLKVDRTNVKVGGKVNFEVRVTDNVGVTNGYIEIEHIASGDFTMLPLAPEGNDLFSACLEVDESILEGKWSVRTIMATDNAANYSYLYNSKMDGVEPGDGTVDLSAGDFTVGKDTPVTPAAPVNPEGSATDKTSVAGFEKQVINKLSSDKTEPARSTFAPLMLRSTKQSSSSVTLTWNKVSGAAGYIVYGAPSGGKLKRLSKRTGTSFTHTKLSKGKYYKYTVVAYKKVGGTQKIAAVSKMCHVATTGGKVTNVSKVKPKKKTVKLKVGKSKKVGAKAVKKSKKLKLNSYRKLIYESSNTSIATVDSRGRITAKKKGKCNIYVYSQTGTYATIRVTVK